MGTIAQHRAGIEANLAAAFTNANTRDYEVKSLPSGRSWVVGWPSEFDPHASQGGFRSIVYSVRFEVTWGDDQASDNALETAMQSAAAAIESDPTLGGSCDDLACRPFTNITAVRKADETTVMTFTVPVEVLD